MRKWLFAVVLALSFVLSGCTVAQFTYIRNLGEIPADIYFDFSTAQLKSVPDSIYVPYSQMSHQVNSKTYSYMRDSIVARRYTGTTLAIHLPAGGMIMFDKSTAKKIGYMAPEKIKVAPQGKEPYTVRVVGPAESGERIFQTKGNSPKIFWHDIY